MTDLEIADVMAAHTLQVQAEIGDLCSCGDLVVSMLEHLADVAQRSLGLELRRPWDARTLRPNVKTQEHPMTDDEWMEAQQREANLATFRHHDKEWGSLVRRPIDEDRQLEIALAALDKKHAASAAGRSAA